MPYFRLSQIERACRRRFKIWWNWKIISLRAISSFPTMLSRVVCNTIIKCRYCLVMDFIVFVTNFLRTPLPMYKSCNIPLLSTYWIRYLKEYSLKRWHNPLPIPLPNVNSRISQIERFNIMKLENNHLIGSSWTIASFPTMFFRVVCSKLVKCRYCLVICESKTSELQCCCYKSSSNHSSKIPLLSLYLISERIFA